MHPVLLGLVVLAVVAQALTVRRRWAHARRGAEAAWSRRHAMAGELALSVHAALPDADAAVAEVLRAREEACSARGLRERLLLERRLGTALIRLRARAGRDADLRTSAPYVLLDLMLGEVEEDLAADVALLAR